MASQVVPVEGKTEALVSGRSTKLDLQLLEGEQGTAIAALDLRISGDYAATAAVTEEDMAGMLTNLNIKDVIGRFVRTNGRLLRLMTEPLLGERLEEQGGDIAIGGGTFDIRFPVWDFVSPDFKNSDYYVEIWRLQAGGDIEVTVADPNGDIVLTNITIEPVFWLADNEGLARTRWTMTNQNHTSLDDTIALQGLPIQLFVTNSDQNAYAQTDYSQVTSAGFGYTETEGETLSRRYDTDHDHPFKVDSLVRVSQFAAPVFNIPLWYPRTRSRIHGDVRFEFSGGTLATPYESMQFIVEERPDSHTAVSWGVPVAAVPSLYVERGLLKNRGGGERRVNQIGLDIAKFNTVELVVDG